MNYSLLPSVLCVFPSHVLSSSIVCFSPLLTSTCHSNVVDMPALVDVANAKKKDLDSLTVGVKNQHILIFGILPK